VVDNGPLVASVVLSYNNFTDTDETVESLLQNGYPNHRVILVDNGSKDGSMLKLRERWGSRIEYIENAANVGVASGYNAGIRAALASGAEYVVLCNNDIDVDPGFITALVETFRKHPDTGVAASLMMYYDAPSRIWVGGCSYSGAFGYTLYGNRGRELGEVRLGTGAFKSPWVPTCATMISREVFEKIGLLDDRLFFGHDDVDISLRARAAGFAVRMLPLPLMRHKVSATAGTPSMSPRTTYLDAKGSILLGAKHFRGRRAPLFFAGLLLMRMPYKLRELVRGREWQNVLPYFRGLLSGFVSYLPLFFKDPALPPRLPGSL
jgi:GT2 family glycosyltransferase